MTEPTKDLEGKTEEGKGKTETGAGEMVPQAEVDRRIAKAVNAAKKEMGDKLTAAEGLAKEKSDHLVAMETQLSELQGKAGTEAERERIRLGTQITKLTTELGEARKTLSAVQTRADADAVEAVVAGLAATATRGKDRVREALAKNCRRNAAGKVVWVDPETDQENEPAKGLEALQKSDPYFWEPPQSGSGASAGAPPVAGKKPLTGMSKAELAAQYDREAGS
jgi:hypothetical protein